MTDEEDNEELTISVNRQTLIVVAFIGVIILAGVLVAGLATLGVLDTDEDEVDFNYPDGASSEGIENATLVVQSHTQTLTNTSYTANIENTQDGESVANLLYQYDVEDQIAFREADVNGNITQAVEDYQNQEQVLAQQFGTENETYSRNFLQRLNPYTASFELANFVRSVSYEATGVEQLSDGTDVVEYEALEPQGQATEQVDNVEGTLRLSEEGVIRSVDITVTAQNQNQTLTENQVLEFSNLGSTDYSEPDWYSTAIEQEDPPEPPQPPQNGGNESDTGGNETDS